MQPTHLSRQLSMPTQNTARGDASLAMVFKKDARVVRTPLASAVVFVVVADVSVRQSLELLIQSETLQAQTFMSAREFLDCHPASVPSCLVLDVSHPGLNALELQKRVAAERPELPIIFITDQADVSTIVRAMKSGAVDFLTKPFKDEALLSAIQQALEQSRDALDRETELHELRHGYGLLTVRERQVMELVVSGLLNKEIGGELGISEITVKAHRGKVMQKMQANSLADLVKMADTLTPPGTRVAFVHARQTAENEPRLIGHW